MISSVVFIADSGVVDDFSVTVGVFIADVDVSATSVAVVVEVFPPVIVVAVAEVVDGFSVTIGVFIADVDVSAVLVVAIVEIFSTVVVVVVVGAAIVVGTIGTVKFCSEFY